MSVTRLSQLRAMLTERPADAFLLFALAQEHRKLGDFSASAKTFAQLRVTHPDYTGLYYHYAAVLNELDEPVSCDEVYRKGIQVAQAQGDTHAESELRNAYLNWQIEQDE